MRGVMMLELLIYIACTLAISALAVHLVFSLHHIHKKLSHASRTELIADIILMRCAEELRSASPDPRLWTIHDNAYTWHTPEQTITWKLQNRSVLRVISGTTQTVAENVDRFVVQPMIATSHSTHTCSSVVITLEMNGHTASRIVPLEQWMAHV